MVATHEDLQRSLGRVEGSQDAMGERMDRFERLVADGFKKLEDSLNGINSRLRLIENKEVERKTAWRVVGVVAAGISAVVSAVVGWAIKIFL